MLDEFMIDMQISHNQIHIYSGKYEQEMAEWGNGNVDQGAILHRSHLVFDPIIQESFKAKLYFRVQLRFIENPSALRRIVANFDVIKNAGIFVSSVPGTREIGLNVASGKYDLYFEECEEDDVDEVYFVITLIHSESPSSPQYLMTDNWGGEAGRKLRTGYF